jgi:hypothetical protein
MDERNTNEHDAGKPNGWDQHKRLVMYRLDGIERSLDKLREQVHVVQHTQVAHATTIRITAAAIGAVAGLVPALLSFVLGSGL